MVVWMLVFVFVGGDTAPARGAGLKATSVVLFESAAACNSAAAYDNELDKSNHALGVFTVPRHAACVSVQVHK